ncbi:MAG: hypothetical protein RLZZ303_3338 [Candidatus Hydrogenedentota bacterium]
MLVPVLVFVLVYVGMMLGRVPGLALDRTGVALLGAVVLIALGVVTPDEAWDSVDVPTIALLLGLMVVSAQFRLGGFYSVLTLRMASAPLGPRALLAAVLLLSASLSALLTNDIICLAMTPLLAEGCSRRGLNPLPYLLALACGANIGSAATLVGNPQNILIGQALQVSFAGYLLQALVPVALSLLAAWLVLSDQYAGKWSAQSQLADVTHPPYSAWQSMKGLAILGAAVFVFLVPVVPREVAALAAAGAVLVSRRMHTREMLGLVDWQLLVLFCGLFVVNHAFAACGALGALMEGLAGVGIALDSPAWLFGVVAVLSNLVSNVPAVMMLLPAATHEDAALILALASTLAGNLIVVSSIANIIVIEQARQCGLKIGWGEHARTGIPVTLASLTIAAVWIALLGTL